MSKPTTAKERVEIELNELADKCVKLQEFIIENPFFKTLTTESQVRLNKQLSLMTDYAEVLKERLQYDFK